MVKQNMDILFKFDTYQNFYVKNWDNKTFKYFLIIAKVKYLHVKIKIV